MTRILALLVLIGLAAGGTAVYSKYHGQDSRGDQFRTEKVTRGDLNITVRATGTVEPEETVDVGAQVVGRISALGKDPRGTSEAKNGKNRIAIDPATAKEIAEANTKPAANSSSANDHAAQSSHVPNVPAAIQGSSATSPAPPSANQASDKSKQGDLPPADHTATQKPGKRAKTNPKPAILSTDYNPAFADKSVDYGSPVEKGMILAQIDPAIYQAQYDQAKASLAAANAKVLQSQAQVTQTQAEWERAERLRELVIPSRSPTGDDNGTRALPVKGISDADYVLAKANSEVAKADLEAAKAAVLQQTAVLALADTNFKYCTILSPIDGTIIDRRVNIGQTVVSSFNTPSLFLIARDLRRMQVWASVNEADIAKVEPGTKVHFRVDALPNDTFHGTVIQRRLNAQMTQNVVIYTVVIEVDNSDLKLLPYLTADVYFEVDSRKDAILVPNAALRFKPTADQIDTAALSENPEPKAEKSARRRHETKEATTTAGRLWVVVPETGKLRPIDVQTGVSDFTASLTEITSGDVHEGDEIVVSENHQNAVPAGGDVTNPLAPPRFRGNRTQPKGPS